MYVNRFWSSVISVVGYLFGIGLLLYVMLSVFTFFGLLTGGLVRTLVTLVLAVAVPIVGTRYYIDWKWNWQFEHIGVNRFPSAGVWLIMGLILGFVAALAAYLISALLSGGGIPLAVPQLRPFSLLDVVMALMLSFIIELVFRGAVISRYQADLPHKELVLAALLTPFAWMMINQFFGLSGPRTGIDSTWTAAMSVFLTLLFLRLDSVWLTAGLRGGMMGATALLTLRVSETGGLAIWGTAALVLLIQEWMKLQGQPQRMRPRRSPPPKRGRTIRGPWGPH